MAYSYKKDGFKGEHKHKPKSELFALEAKLNKIPITKENREAVTRKKKHVRYALYECWDCADAKFRKDIDGVVLFAGDCEKDECPHRDYFLNKAGVRR